VHTFVHTVTCYTGSMNVIRPFWVQEWWRKMGTAVWNADLIVEDAVLQTTHAPHTLLQLSAFSETTVQLHTIRIRENTVEILGVFVGCHTSNFAGIPPTQRRVRLPISLTCTIRRERVTHVVLAYDPQVFLQQLGLIP